MSFLPEIFAGYFFIFILEKGGTTYSVCGYGRVYK